MKVLWWIVTLPFRVVSFLVGLLARSVLAIVGLAGIALGVAIVVNDISTPIGITLMIAGTLLFWRAIW